MSDARPSLTDRQRVILDTIRFETRRRGCPPTYREIAAALGIASPNAILQHVRRLERKGYLRHPGGRKRMTFLVDDIRELEGLRALAAMVVARARPIPSEDGGKTVCYGLFLDLTEREWARRLAAGES